VTQRRTPVSLALRDWGKANRFAGSKDRSAIGNYVHDALRRQSSLGYRMGDDSPRAIILGAVVLSGGADPQEVADSFEGDKHAPTPITDAEMEHLKGCVPLDSAEPWIQADVPEWLWPAFETNFGEDAIAEASALTNRPPLDVRVNTLKSTMEEALEALAELGGVKGDSSPIGIRFQPREGDGRLPNVQIEKIFQTGGVEIQDEDMAPKTRCQMAAI